MRHGRNNLPYIVGVAVGGKQFDESDSIVELDKYWGNR